METAERAPSWMAMVRKGSIEPIASTSPRSRAAGMSGSGISTNSTSPGSPPCASMAARMVVSLMLFRVFTPTVLPCRSAASWMSLSARTRTSAKSSPWTPVELLALAMICSGSPWDRATIRDVTLLKPKSISPLTTDGTMAAPPWAWVMSSSRPSSSKKPCSIPR